MRYSLTGNKSNFQVADRFIPLRESIQRNVLSSQMNSPDLISKDNQYLENIVSMYSKTFQYSKTKENLHHPIVEVPEVVSKAQKKIKIMKNPVKVLEAPSLLDDYYLSLVSWSRQNLIGVGLSNSIYFFNFLSHSVQKHYTINYSESRNTLNSEEDLNSYICGLTFDEFGTNLIFGDSQGKIYQTDVETNKLITHGFPHSSRVGSFHLQNNLLISGSRDKSIKLFDVRQKNFTPIHSFVGHNQEICGIKISPDSNLIASGGNDNQLLLWDMRKMKLMGSIGKHEAAVKALAWNPNKRNILLSGAGTADRKIRIFDVHQHEQIGEIDSGSQVCNIAFDKEGEHIISTHGYSLNQLIIWKPLPDYSNMFKEDLLIAHKLRVLYLSQSPCGKYLATGAGDETIRIWNLVNKNRNSQRLNSMNDFNNSYLNVR